MAVLLTLRTDLPYYRQEVTLDDVTYILELKFNTRSSCWFLSLYDRDENPILVGRKVTLGLPVWSRYKNLALPPGQLVAVDTTQKDSDPGEKDLGGRVQLVYLTADEV